MGKMEGVFKIEMVRLAKREVNRVSVPLKREVRSLKRVGTKAICRPPAKAAGTERGIIECDSRRD